MFYLQDGILKNKPKIIQVIEVSEENIKENALLRLSLTPGHFLMKVKG